MTQLLSEKDYLALQKRLEAGTAELTVPRQIARQFFFRVTSKAVVSITGQSVLLQKAFLHLLFAVSVGLFMACLALLFTGFNLGAAIAIPAIGIFWTIITLLTSDKGNQWVGHLGVSLSLLPLLFLSPSYSYPLALIGVSIWLHRWMYFLARYWLVALVTRSYDAFDMMVEHIDITEKENQGDPVNRD